MFERIRALLGRREQIDAELDEELAFHLEVKADRIAKEQGIPREEAMRQARLSFGNRANVKADTRQNWTFGKLEGILQDIRFALRTLVRDRGFTAVAVLTLALGLGANTAIFSLLNGLLLKRLPVHEPDQLVRMVLVDRGKNTRSWENGQPVSAAERRDMSYPLTQALREQKVFEDFLLIGGTGPMHFESGGVAKNADGRVVSGNYFEVLGVRPHLGRTFSPDADRPGANWELVLGHAFWTSRFHADPGVLGQTIYVERTPFTVVGVAAAEFPGIHPGHADDFWIPLHATEAMWPDLHFREKYGFWWLEVVARTRGTIAAAQQALDARTPAILEGAMGENPPADMRKDFANYSFKLHPNASGESWVQRQYGRALWLLQGAVVLVLLIAATNVANLVLARATARRKEMAVRRALGASRGTLIRQTVVESLILAVAGTGLGLLLSRWVTTGFLALGSSEEMLLSLDFSPDVRLLLFLAAAATVTVLLCGLIPALRSSSVSPQEVLKQASGGSRRLTFRKSLVVAQLSLSVVLIAGAGLFVASFRAALTENTGFDRSHITAILVDTGVPRSQLAELYREVERMAANLPGVTSVAWTLTLPLQGGMSGGTVNIPGRTDISPERRFLFGHTVGANYFATMGLPLLAGRDFDPARPLEQVSIIDEQSARDFFGSPQQALGRQMGNATIIGVVANAKYMSLKQPMPKTAYRPYWSDKEPRPGMTLLIKTATNDASSAVRAMTAFYTKRLGKQPLIQVRSLDAVALHSLQRDSLLSTVLTAFAVLALLIAATGLYGLLAFAVNLRRREIGIRLALGAEGGVVVRQVLREAVMLLTLSLAVGLALAFFSQKAVAGFLYNTQPTDPVVWMSGAGILLTAGLLAAFLPAARAARLDPMSILRDE